MKYTMLFLFVLLIQRSSFGQLNYDDIRGNMITYCGKVNDSIIWHNAHFVDSVSKLKIANGLDHFLEDYAGAYYAKYMRTKDRHDLIVSINAHTRRWEQFNSIDALYNMASCYAGFDCYMSLKYFKILEEKIEKNEIDFPENKELYVSQMALVREMICPE